MTETIEIDVAALDLLDADGYMRRYYSIVSERGCSLRAAFSQIESEYRQAFRRGKYGSYKSFCRVRRRWHIKRRLLSTKQ